MLSTEEIRRLRVIDTDAHVTEPADLWTSRLPKKWEDQIPAVSRHPKTGVSHWRVGDKWLTPVGYYAPAGWRNYPPDRPKEFAEIPPGAWIAEDRLKLMDDLGLYAQVLYPNLIGFESPVFIGLGSELAVQCVRAYNDFIADFAGTDPKRLVPVAMMPFWDLDATKAEMQRWRDLGHSAVLWANKFQDIGLPQFYDQYWDPVLSVAQDLDLSLNFHVGFAAFREQASQVRSASDGKPADVPSDVRVVQIADEDRRWEAREETAKTASLVMSLSDCIAKIVTSGICDRYPTLKFVSVESGFGYVPYLLESLDWHWLNFGAHRGSELLPSEYFKRQCYGTFWFERGTLKMLDDYADNFMFETDFPHLTSLTPGGASAVDHPCEHIQKSFVDVSPETTIKVLHGNAARLYELSMAGDVPR